MGRSLETRNDIINRLENFIFKLQVEGEKFLPSERKLCTEFGNSRETIRRALETLEDKKMLIKEASKRFIVRPKKTRGSVAFVTSGWGAICSSAWSRLWSAFEPLAKVNGIEVSLALYNWSKTDKIWPGKLEKLPDVIVYAGAPNQIIEDKVLELKNACPIIAVDERYIGVMHYVVTLDNYEAGRLAAKLFVENGRTKPAFIGMGGTAYLPFLERERGFSNTLMEAGIELGLKSRKMLSVSSSNPDYTIQLAKYCEDIAKQGNDSLFVYSDEGISTVYSAINKKIPLPTKFSLVTLNGTTQCLSHSPAISAISHASNKVAAGLVKLIIRILENGNNVPETIIKMTPEVYHGATL
ncbi:MAG: hypothetical protein A2020_09490 [Lentisphaerae bacterium GWF2_45_14]|nr:MAG: hypothetical protein A2020_09490 [Lentisphaerae bacterium GWF2_45_14]